MRPGLLWIALGAAVSVAAWRMDRLQSLNIEPWSAPGLVPGVLGIGMVLFGFALAFGGARSDAQDAGPSPVPWLRLGLVAALCVAFGFIALGRMPFGIAAALLMFVWMTMLGWPSWSAGAARWRGVMQAALISAGASFVITHLFQDIFLVRLP
jgi:hypothetical protein